MFELTSFNENDLLQCLNQLEKNLFQNISTVFTQYRSDIVDFADKYVLQVELPGFSKEDINISIEGEFLIVTANRNQDIQTSETQFVKSEYKSESFHRSVDVCNVKKDQIKARYRNGLLEVDLPKDEKQPQKQTIQIEIE